MPRKPIARRPADFRRRPLRGRERERQPELSADAQKWIENQLKGLRAKTTLKKEELSSILNELIFIAKNLEARGELENNLKHSEYLRKIIETNPLQGLKLFSNLVNLKEVPIEQSLKALKEFAPLIETKNPRYTQIAIFSFYSAIQKHGPSFLAKEGAPMRKAMVKKIAQLKNINHLPAIIQNPMSQSA